MQAACNWGHASGMQLGGTTGGMHYAQGSVSRLGRAIDAAEEEMDATLRRASGVQKTQLRQAEADLTEMHHLVHSKERSLQALRDTLAQAQRSHEQQMSKAEAALGHKDAEVRLHA
jgi:chromosome segregation ATPase